LPNYEVETFDRHVCKRLDTLSDQVLRRVARAIQALAENPRPHGCMKLKGIDGWHIRVGPWRVIDHVGDRGRLITIVEVRRRSESTFR
jgi:mRNA interferase RelE/StbE